jgi:uncharacterized protein YecE (DUF72 family)
MGSGKILVGTASWTDPTLIKSRKFYPPEAKSAEARLKFYASNFPLVEVDSTYYAMPSVNNATLWADRTPEQFVFNIKAFRLLTQHQTEPKVLPANVQAALGEAAKKKVYYDDLPAEVRNEVWREWTLALEPLRVAGKLGAMLFQFPKWFIVRRSSFDHIRAIREYLPHAMLAVEFRHESWFSERHRASTLSFERELGLCNVIVDGPQNVRGSIPSVWEVTNQQLAIFRLHGRNAETWNKKGLAAASDRFNYDYAESELRSFIDPVRALADQANDVHVVFNNNLEDQGVRNARTMIDLLGNHS